MSAYIRRFLFDPGDEVLLDIESVNILDLEPPAPINGVGSGTVCMVGEFEDGPFEEPTEMGSPTDLLAVFGGLGHTYDGVGANNPCARSRKADSAIKAEYWNGNGFIQLSGKRFYRLILVRVDTSVGEVQFTRLASLNGTARFTYKLTSGQKIVFDVGAGPVEAEFTGEAAEVTGESANFAGIAPGDTATFGYDEADDFDVTFLAPDTTIGAVVARINQFAGFNFASNDGGELKLTGRVKGTDGEVRVVSGSTGTLTNLGLTAGNTPGTGNVGNIDAVTLVEADSVVSNADPAASIEIITGGIPRLFTTENSITVTDATTATVFGFPVGVTATAASGNEGVIPAGTRVREASGQQFVTMQSIEVAANNAGPYTVKVRHATDDGTGTEVATGDCDIIESPIALDAFSVVNALPLGAALTEDAIDTQYEAAIDTTVDINTVAKEVNIIYSARQSNTIRRKLRENALEASANGCQGRIACVRPPLGTKKDVARNTNAEPGIGPYRDQRVIYNYPGFATRVPAIAKRGVSGGAGFTANGVVDVGSDGFCASVMSQLPPEENPGQETPFMTSVVGLESSPNAQKFGMNDYKLFKKAGICAPRIQSGVVTFQSGVTAVDPQVNPGLKNIARRRMADFIQDTLAIRLTAFSKKSNKKTRRTAMETEIRTFMNGLLGLTNEAQQRIDGYALETGAKAGNTVASMAKGLYRMILRVRNMSSLDSIVLQCTVGEGVADVTELAPGALAA